MCDSMFLYYEGLSAQDLNRLKLEKVFFFLWASQNGDSFFKLSLSRLLFQSPSFLTCSMICVAALSERTSAITYKFQNAAAKFELQKSIST